MAHISLEDAILRALDRAGAAGLSRSDLFYGRNLTVTKLNAALIALLAAGKARRTRVKTRGRPAEMWFAV